MKLKIEKIIFILIILVSFTTRFYKLGQIPPGLDWDENSNSYNAYSILKTGRDEYGKLLPMTNRSFDDYKPPLYMYLDIPAVALFGLTPTAARLPAATFGFLTVPVIYLLAKKLFTNKKIALLAMTFLAISSWHIQFSRAGFEATVGLFFATAAVTALLYGLQNRRFFILAGTLFAISIYTYHAERIFVPLFFTALAIIFRKELFEIPRKILLSFIILGLAFILPLAILTPRSVIVQRFETTTSGGRLQDIEKSIKFILQDEENHLKYGKIIHNRRFVIAQTYFGNYLSHFDFNFLFTKGDDNFRHHIQDMGMLYLFELPLFLFGTYRLIRHRTNASLVVLSWLLLSPIAAVPAVPTPHANRALLMVIPLELISAYAFVNIFTFGFRFRKLLLLASCVLIASSFLIYLHNYYSHYSDEKSSFWQYGYSQAAKESQNYKNQFDKIYVDRTIEEAYIFWLFNTKYDPMLYQKTGSKTHFDKYYFDAKPPQNQRDLFIAEAKSFPGGFVIVKTIYYPNGEEAIKIGYPK